MNKKQYYVRMINAVGHSFKVPVYAESFDDAISKAKDWPYSDNWNSVDPNQKWSNDND